MKSRDARYEVHGGPFQCCNAVCPHCCRPMGKDVMQHTGKLTVDGSAEVLIEFCCG